MNWRIYTLLIGVLAVCALIVILSEETSAESGDTRADAQYVGGEVCAGCHPGVDTEWMTTAHGLDFTAWDYHGTPTNKLTYAGGSCAACHVVGYNLTSIGGYDPDQAYDSETNAKLQGIQCEACHGPGSEHREPGSDKKATIDVDVDPYTSCSGTEFAECHGGTRQFGTEEIPGWTASAHAPFDNAPDDRGFNTACAECKSPSQYDPEATREDAAPITAEDYRGITCGDCHDAMSETDYEFQLNWDPEEACDACHNGGHHETMRTQVELDGTPSVDRALYPYMEEVSCVKCHMWGTPRGTPDEYINVGHSFEPSISACVDCHDDVWDEMPSSSDPQSDWDNWTADLDEAIEEWGGVVEAAQERHDELLEEVEALVHILEGDDTAAGLIPTAEENNLWTDEMEEDFEQAFYDFELAEHASRGAHNPAYNTALLTSAEEAFSELIDELSMGVLTGNITDSPGPIADVYVFAGGVGTMTDSGGTYTLHLPPGTYTVTASKLGTIDDEAKDVVVAAAAVTVQNFTLDDDFDNDGTPDTADDDDDNDGYTDSVEEKAKTDPQDYEDTPKDMDGDLIPDDDDDDIDGDGLPNTYEEENDMDPEDSSDVTAEILEEFQAGGGGDDDDEDDDDMTAWYIVIVLIIVIVLMAVAMGKKGGSPPAEGKSRDEDED